MILRDILAQYKPEPSTHEIDDWSTLNFYLWCYEGQLMANLMDAMADAGGWIEGPVLVHDGFVQDAHHRLCCAVELRWRNLDIPVEPIHKEVP